MNKKKGDRFGVVFSTDPTYRYESSPLVEPDTIAPNAQKLRVMVDRKQRGGKEVTLVTGFVGKTEDLEALGKLLKNKCGSGGSAKEGEILVQGNHRDKVVKLLVEMGYTGTKPVGG